MYPSAQSRRHSFLTARQTRLSEKPLISRRVTMAMLRMDSRKASAASLVAAEVRSFHMTSTMSSSVGVMKLRLNVLSFLPTPAPISELRNDELLVVSSVFSGASASICAQTVCLSSSCSGTFSITMSASASASARASCATIRPRTASASAPLSSPRETRSSSHPAILPPARSSTCLSTSTRATRLPCRAQRKASIEPCTPAPTMATF